MGIGEHLDALKQHWARNFAFLDYFKKVYSRHQPLPRWSDADIDEFIASDPVYGPQLKALRESRNFALGGALVGGAHLGGVAFKYSKSPHGVMLSTGFRALYGVVFESEVAEHWYQPVLIIAYGDASRIAPSVLEALSATGISLNHVPAGAKDGVDKKMLVDMLFWAFDNPPPEEPIFRKVPCWSHFLHPEQRCRVQAINSGTLLQLSVICST